MQAEHSLTCGCALKFTTNAAALAQDTVFEEARAVHGYLSPYTINVRNYDNHKFKHDTTMDKKLFTHDKYCAAQYTQDWLSPTTSLQPPRKGLVYRVL